MNDILKEDFRGLCYRIRCIYNDEGRCDMYDNIYIPEDVNKCDDYEEY